MYTIFINFKDRIKLLSRRLYLFIREFDKDRQYTSDSVKAGKLQVDRVFNEYYYVIRSYMNKVTDEIENQKAHNLNLQRQLTTLRNEKADLEHTVVHMNEKLDEIEDNLGVYMQQTRLKLSQSRLSNKEQEYN